MLVCHTERPAVQCYDTVEGRSDQANWGVPLQVGAGDGNLRPGGKDRRAEEGENAACRGRAAEDAGASQQEENRAEDH